MDLMGLGGGGGSAHDAAAAATLYDDFESYDEDDTTDVHQQHVAPDEVDGGQKSRHNNK